MLPLGLFTEMTPPQAHMHFALLMSAGIFITFTCPGGAQGAVITGTQGIGVSVPQAAAVAAATVGFASDWHMPKGMMFDIGTMSMMFAISIFPHLGRRGTVTISDDGAIPKLHCSIAPIHTKFPIIFQLSTLNFQLSFGASSVFSLAESDADEGAPGIAMPSLMFEDLNDVLASRLSMVALGAFSSSLTSVLALMVVAP